MALRRSIDSTRPDLTAPVGRLVRPHKRREVAVSGHLAAGTLACPACDAPVAPPAAALSPADPLDCGFCNHPGRVRDFLSLVAPTRPTRVDVRVVQRARGG
ncbi:MAG: hypothetical protein WD844_01260 [Thermoleophilaceae bacterium]